MRTDALPLGREVLVQDHPLAVFRFILCDNRQRLSSFLRLVLVREGREEVRVVQQQIVLGLHHFFRKRRGFPPKRVWGGIGGCLGNRLFRVCVCAV